MHQVCTIQGDTEDEGEPMGVPGGLYGGTTKETTPCPKQLNANNLDECQAGRRCFVKV